MGTTPPDSADEQRPDLAKTEGNPKSIDFSGLKLWSLRF